MKINGRDVNGRKYSFNSSINSSINSLKSTSSRKARNKFDSAMNSKNISSIDSIFQVSNLNRDVTRDFSSSKGKQNAQFEQTFSKIILILIFGPMILNLVISIISALFLGIEN